MDKPPRYDSRLWTGDLPDVPPAKGAQSPSGITWQSDLFVRRRIAFLTFSPLLAWPARLVIQAFSGDLLTSVPPVINFCVLVVCFGLLLIYLAAKFELPRWVGALSGLAGWAVAVLAASYVALAVSAHATAAVGPEEPARIARVGGGRYDHSIVIEFSNGSWISAWGYREQRYGSLGRCLTVQRRNGPFSFSWLHIVSAAPLPQGSQLAWPTDPATCFSDVRRT